MQSMAQELLLYAIVLCNPRRWMRNYPTSRALDKTLRNAIKTSEFTEHDQYTTKLGGLNLWTENAPYASWREWDENFSGEELPSRRTVVLLERKFAAYHKIRMKDIPK